MIKDPFQVDFLVVQNCVPTAHKSVEMGILMRNEPCKYSNKNALSHTQRKCEKELGETAKPLFIGSISDRRLQSFQQLNANTKNRKSIAANVAVT